MSMQRSTTLLISFTSKIEDAVVLVPRMGVTEKLKAVQFWNIISEKLQDIVNRNAADINAVALKMDGSDANEMCLEMSHLPDALNSLNNTSDFITATPTSAIYNEYSTQFSNSDLQNSHLKQQFPPELINPNIEQIGSQVEVAHLTEMHNVRPDTGMPQHKTGDSCAQFQGDLGLTFNCDNGTSNTQAEHPACYHDDTNFSLKHTTSSELPSSQSLLQAKKEVTSNAHVGNEMNYLKLDLMKSNSKSKSSTSSNYKKLNSKTMIDSEDSLSTGDVEPHISFEGVDNENSEVETFVNTNTKDILEECEDRLHDINKNSTKDDLIYNCEICGNRYSSPGALKQHGFIHKKTFSCTECTSVFATNTKLVVHMRRHTGEKPYACHECSACFSTQGNLKRHVMSHNGVKPWKCTECDTCFTEKKSLTIHMRRHTGERPYKCKICGKGFTQTGVLESHMAVHLGIKKHLCEKCGKAFRQKSQLRVHKLRHENVKKYKCDACPMLFVTKADLERHGKTHSGEKMYACELCNAKFTRQQSLNEHLNRHYGIKPYACEHCGKKFPEMSSFYKHLKFHNKTSKTSHQDKSEVNNLQQEITKTEDPTTRSETSNVENVMPSLKAKDTEHLLPTLEEDGQYITVVLNREDTNEVVQVGDNQTVLCGTENSDVNNFGVLTTINMTSTASIMPAGYLS